MSCSLIRFSIGLSCSSPVRRFLVLLFTPVSSESADVPCTTGTASAVGVESSWRVKGPASALGRERLAEADLRAGFMVDFGGEDSEAVVFADVENVEGVVIMKRQVAGGVEAPEDSGSRFGLAGV